MKSIVLNATGAVAVGALLLFASPLLAQTMTTEPVAAPVEAPVEPTAPAHEIDTVHSYVVFNIEHMGVGTNWGQFTDLSGTIHFDPANLAGSRIHVKVAMASLDTKNEARDKHAKSADYLNTASFPVAEFVSTAIAPAGENLYAVKGNMTFMGVTKPLATTFKFHGAVPNRGGGTRAGADAEFVLKRSDFGVEELGGLGDEVKVFVSIEAIAKPASEEAATPRGEGRQRGEGLRREGRTGGARRAPAQSD
ncbi:MAG: hypothetical protein PWP23_21 [Candidatus Sumerlaeota bacterium]|nr:hypothetical protein [Candidatus Sumerlaeota bacterium]